jgi:zinc transport system permease protein
VVIALAGAISGLFFSYHLDIPSGASIIFSLILLFLLARSFKAIYLRLYSLQSHRKPEQNHHKVS